MPWYTSALTVIPVVVVIIGSLVKAFHWYREREYGEDKSVHRKLAHEAIEGVDSEDPAWMHAKRARGYMVAKSRAFPHPDRQAVNFFFISGIAALANLATLAVIRVTIELEDIQLKEALDAFYISSMAALLMFFLFGFLLIFIQRKTYAYRLLWGIDELIEREIELMERSLPSAYEEGSEAPESNDGPSESIIRTFTKPLAVGKQDEVEDEEENLQSASSTPNQ